MSGALDGKAGVITGGGSGIGRALADAFTAAGATVAVLDLTGADAAAAELGGGAIALTADVTDEAAVAAAFAEAAERLGRLDFLVNSAGIRHVARFTELPVDVWRRTIAAHYPGGGWIRLQQETLDALGRVKAERGLHTFDDTVRDLL